MNVTDYVINKVSNGYKIDIVATAPSPGWTNIDLYAIKHSIPQKNGIQEIILEGLPPNSNLSLVDAVHHALTIFIKDEPWIKTIQIRDSLGFVLKAISLTELSDKNYSQQYVNAVFNNDQLCSYFHELKLVISSKNTCSKVLVN